MIDLSPVPAVVWYALAVFLVLLGLSVLISAIAMYEMFSRRL